MPLVGGDVRVQTLGVDCFIVRAPGLCADPGFVERVVTSLAWAARPGHRLDRRDQLIRALAETRYEGKTRARAVAMLKDVRRYEACRWRFDRGKAILPKELAGTVQGNIWHILKASTRFPGLRQLQNIIKGPFAK